MSSDHRRVHRIRRDAPRFPRLVVPVRGEQGFTAVDFAPHPRGHGLRQPDADTRSAMSESVAHGTSRRPPGGSSWHDVGGLELLAVEVFGHSRLPAFRPAAIRNHRGESASHTPRIHPLAANGMAAVARRRGVHPVGERRGRGRALGLFAGNAWRWCSCSPPGGYGLWHDVGGLELVVVEVFGHSRLTSVSDLPPFGTIAVNLLLIPLAVHPSLEPQSGLSLAANGMAAVAGRRGVHPVGERRGRGRALGLCRANNAIHSQVVFILSAQLLSPSRSQS